MDQSQTTTYRKELKLLKMLVKQTNIIVIIRLLDQKMLQKKYLYAIIVDVNYKNHIYIHYIVQKLTVILTKQIHKYLEL